MVEQDKLQKSEQQWREQLTHEQYIVLRQKGTERPFTGKYVNEKRDGVYQCAACGNELFSSETKFESYSGYKMRPESNTEIQVFFGQHHL